jgi:hypothetical protein
MLQLAVAKVDGRSQFHTGISVAEVLITVSGRQIFQAQVNPGITTRRGGRMANWIRFGGTDRICLEKESRVTHPALQARRLRERFFICKSMSCPALQADSTALSHEYVRPARFLYPCVISQR